MTDQVRIVALTLSFEPPSPESSKFPCKVAETYQFKLDFAAGADPLDLQFHVQLDRSGLAEDEQVKIFAYFLQLPEIREAEARGLLTRRFDGANELS